MTRIIESPAADLQAGIARDGFVFVESALMGPSLSRGTISPLEYQQVIGSAFEGSEHDLIALAMRAKSGGGALPRLRVDCGTEDHLLDDNRRVHRALVQVRMPAQP